MPTNAIPLPEPDGSLWADGWVQQGWIGKSMHAHAAAVSAAARDCRSCIHYDQWLTFCRKAEFEQVLCTNADRYDPLPPVRLWRTTP